MAGLIFYGPPDTEGALERAAMHLGTTADALGSCVCFLRYTDKPVMDDIRQLLNRINLKSDGYAVMFDQADLLSANCQNAMLKALEDRDDVLFIFMAGDVRLLGTVESRSVILNSKGLTLAQYAREYRGKPNSFYYLASGNRELLEEVLSDGSICELVETAGRDVLSFLSDKHRLLCALGQMKEKDASNFFEKHKELVPGLYGMLEHLLLEHIEKEGVVEMLDTLEKHKRLFRKSNSYGKNDFLDCLINL